MSIVVQKFGGTSVADNEKLWKVCEHIRKEYEKGQQIVIVVSAQGQYTNTLLKEAYSININPSLRELDMLLSTGEQITIAKLSLCLHELNFPAISLAGWQVPIQTNEIHGNANIINIPTDKIKKLLNDGNIVIVAGFQGINQLGEITTLGRGGSDTTAVALAAALQAERCDIFTDVDRCLYK